MTYTITQSELKSQLHYDQDTGIFTMLVSNRKSRIGSISGCLSNGYIRIYLNRKLYYAHRLAWLYIHGVIPTNQIDHINGVKSDNRTANLREATNVQNGQNLTESHVGNKSGYLGVNWNNPAGKYQARIALNGKQINLGLYKTAELASEAYLAKKREIHDFCTI